MHGNFPTFDAKVWFSSRKMKRVFVEESPRKSDKRQQKALCINARIVFQCKSDILAHNKKPSWWIEDRTGLVCSFGAKIERADGWTVELVLQMTKRNFHCHNCIIIKNSIPILNSHCRNIYSQILFVTTILGGVWWIGCFQVQPQPQPKTESDSAKHAEEMNWNWRKHWHTIFISHDK